MTEALEHHGFAVTTAVDGRAALDVLQLGAYDVMVLDDEMPHLSGHAVLVRLRAEGCRLPVVLVSGSLQLDEDECSRLDVGPVLRKPVPVDKLVHAIRDALPS